MVYSFFILLYIDDQFFLLCLLYPSLSNSKCDIKNDYFNENRTKTLTQVEKSIWSPRRAHPCGHRSNHLCLFRGSFWKEQNKIRYIRLRTIERRVSGNNIHI
jgi:hypothetical protein